LQQDAGLAAAIMSQLLFLKRPDGGTADAGFTERHSDAKKCVNCIRNDDEVEQLRDQERHLTAPG
jgi:hypothetical protein